MPRVLFPISFSFEEALALTGYMEKVGAYGGYKTGKTAFDVMEEFNVLETFTKLRELVRRELDKEEPEEEDVMGES
jgi:hypothetical protein